MKKYAVTGLMLLAGHEIVSIVALIAAAVMFLSDIANAAEQRHY